MKEYCLVPVSVAERCKFKPTDSATQHRFTSKQVKKKKKTSLPLPAAALPDTATVAPPPRAPVNPPLDDLIRVAVPPSFREYGLSLLKLLEGKPGISWDERGNLLPPFSGISVFDLIRVLGHEKGAAKRLSPDKRPLLSLLLRMAQLPADAIRNTTQRSKLIGGGVGDIWEAY